MRNNMAKTITDKLKLREVMEFYGIKFDSKGFARCPFHNEKTASLTIKKEHYKCFGCGAYGGAIDFVMKYHGLQFRQALLKLDSDFSLGIVGGKAPSYRERELLAENQRLERVCLEYKENLHQNYLKLCTAHSVLFRQYCKGNMELKDIIEEIDNVLNDFTGEEARLWMEM